MVSDIAETLLDYRLASLLRELACGNSFPMMPETRPRVRPGRSAG
jgi:hypothetical protein